MSKTLIKVFLIVIGVTMLISFIRVQFSFKEVGLSNTKTPQEALSQGVLIKKVEPNPNEIPYNSNLNLKIESAWLEKYYTRQNRIFWVSKTLDSNKYLIKISYVLKDKTTGKVYPSNSARPILEATSGNNLTINWGNTIGSIIKGDPGVGFSLKIYDGVNKGQVVSFK